eukprot:CAMPEP_0176124172 /NCGR_PEP_ID=MMETSP0120_2-20121206/62596_1 /TAXON_ID=160619 /ORGANISM="Kryptoperidinium foliaceum, Strain CCMP 1326" /LENGTH=469 /DNA_ID=CAMNT_0017458925 /DNA_START=206 /DNA_END=1612 /DNA_ORIENTATION=+
METLFANEESPLLGKDPNLTHFSNRTSGTLSTTGSGSYRGGLDGLFVPPPSTENKNTDNDSSFLVSQDEEACIVDNLTGSTVCFSAPGNADDEAADGTFVDNVVEQCYEVAEAAIEEFHGADEGERHYLETGLTRNCSVLPSDVMDAVACGKQKQPPWKHPSDYDLESYSSGDGVDGELGSTQVPAKAYFLLASAVVSLSSIAPLLDLQTGTSPTMKIVWRQAATAMLFFPFASWEIYQNGWPRLSIPQWMTFMVSTSSYAIFSVTFVIALGYTSVGNVVILSNTMSLILLIGKLFVGDPVSLLECMGAMVAFGGAYLCSRDSASHHGTSNALYGDVLAIASAIGGVGYLVFAKASRQHIPMMTFMFLTMAVGDVLLVGFQLWILNETVTFDRDKSHGLWGFLTMQPDRLPLEFTMAFVCNCLGTMGYIRSMQYFDNLVISSATLLEPVVAEFMACALGVGRLPGIHGW